MHNLAVRKPLHFASRFDEIYLFCKMTYVKSLDSKFIIVFLPFFLKFYYFRQYLCRTMSFLVTTLRHLCEMMTSFHRDVK